MESLLFNIFLSELFFIVKDVIIASPTNDITLYDSCNTIEEVLLSLQILQTKFSSGPQTKWRIISIEQGNSLVVRSNCERMLRVKTDCKLNSDKLVKPFSSKVNSKLRELVKLDTAARLKSLY